MAPGATPFRVYLDVSIGSKGGGRIAFDLYRDVSPLAAENFRGLCTGEYGLAKSSNLPLSFKGCKFFRVVPGFIAQSGDFESNNGDGGESVYGGSFRDESFLRRHAQAGVLSMANHGPNTNGSQFFITLKRAPHLDGRHVAFGQVVEGMDILRVIERCPLDANGSPRVPIVITDCGQIARKPGPRKDDPRFQMRDAVETLMATLDSEKRADALPVKMTEAMKAAKFLETLAKEGDALPTAPRSTDRVQGAKLAEAESPPQPIDAESEPAEEAEEVLDLSDERQRKLNELRLRLNQSQAMNTKAAAAEIKAAGATDAKQRFYLRQTQMRDALTDLNRAWRKTEDRGKREGDAELKRARSRSPEGDESDGSSEEGWKKKSKKNKKFERYLKETAETIEARDRARKQKLDNKINSFGWNAMNPDAQFRAHEKRTEKMTLQQNAYAAQILQLGEHFYEPTSALVSAEFKPTEEAKERLVQTVETQRANRREFSRRRMYLGDELNVTFINEKNRVFNQKLERAFGAQSAEIRQNLERGTAI